MTLKKTIENSKFVDMLHSPSENEYEIIVTFVNVRIYKINKMWLLSTFGFYFKTLELVNLPEEENLFL